MRRFERRIYILALHYTRDPHDAEDLAQEAWLKAFKSLHAFRGDAGFYTWLRQIMINTFLNHRRGQESRWRTARSVGYEDSAPDAGNELSVGLSVGKQVVEEGYERRVLVGSIMQALGELTAQQRLIFLLKHREGMTYQEISIALGCSIGTVKKSLARAIHKMRGQLGVSATPLEYARCGGDRTG